MTPIQIIDGTSSFWFGSRGAGGLPLLKSEFIHNVRELAGRVGERRIGTIRLRQPPLWAHTPRRFE